jgi:menaquinone-dependent protoporphyrinogen IX oxidase
MKSIIVYQSKSGYTKRYMEMLSELVEATLVELKTLNPMVLSDYDNILYAGGVYAGKISGIKKFFKLYGDKSCDKLVIVAVGASPSTNELKNKLMDDNLILEYNDNSDKLEFFYLQGGFDPDKLNFALRAMLGAVSKSIQKKQRKTPESLTDEDKSFLEFFRTANDQTSIEQLIPISKFIGTSSTPD